MTKMLIIIKSSLLALILFVQLNSSLKLTDYDEDNILDGPAKHRVLVDSRHFIDSSEQPTSYANAKQANTAATTRSEFLDQNYALYAHKFDLNREYRNLTILFGANGNTWLMGGRGASALYKFDLENNDDLTNSLQPFSINTATFTFDNMFLNKFSPNIVIFADSKSKKMKWSRDDRKRVEGEKSVPFRPDQFYFTPDNDFILGAELNGNKQNLWISFDFGQNWRFLAKDLVKTPEWEKSKTLDPSIYFIDENQLLIQVNVTCLKTNIDNSLEATAACKQVLKTSVRSFDLFGSQFLFITRIENEGMMVLEVLYKKSTSSKQRNLANNSFELAKFALEKNARKIIDYNVVWADESEIIVAVLYSDFNGKIRANLFSTHDFKTFKFDLTLTNVVFDPEKGDLEVRALNKKGGVFLANVKSETDIDLVKTFFKSKASSNWNELNLSPEFLDSHLELDSRKLKFAHEYEQSLLDDPRSPDFAITTGLYVSKADSSHWSRILEGSYLYTFGYYGHILVVVDSAQPTNELIYSLNKGYDWSRLKFSSEPLQINELLTHPDFTTTSNAHFILIGTNPITNKKLIFKLNSKKMIATPPKSISNKIEPATNVKCTQTCLSMKFPSQTICIDDETKLKCNGKYDCADKSDEKGCGDDDDDDDDDDKTTPKPNVDTEFRVNNVNKIDDVFGQSKITMILLVVFVILMFVTSLTLIWILVLHLRRAKAKTTRRPVDLGKFLRNMKTRGSIFRSGDPEHHQYLITAASDSDERVYVSPVVVS